MNSQFKHNPIQSLNPLSEDGFTDKSGSKIREENIYFRKIVENSVGISFVDKAQKLFQSARFNQFDSDRFEEELNQNLASYRVREWIQRWSINQKSNLEIQAIYREIFEKTCSTIYLEQDRKNLLKWIDKVQKGRALFVDCLMGVGKSHSIVKVLGRNHHLSTVIFLSTNKLCTQMVEDLKTEIIRTKPILRDEYPDIMEQEEAVDEDGELISDDIVGMPIFRWTREFLER